jgi:hypothetical protein
VTYGEGRVGLLVGSVLLCNGFSNLLFLRARSRVKGSANWIYMDQMSLRRW